jgi:hypothetical protein
MATKRVYVLKEVNHVAAVINSVCVVGAVWSALSSHTVKRPNCAAPCRAAAVRAQTAAEADAPARTHTGCGGGLEYLFRSPASRKRRLKGDQVSAPCRASLNSEMLPL